MRIFFILLFLSFSIKSFPQSNTVTQSDSLKNYIRTGRFLIRSNIDSAKTIFDECYAKAITIKNDTIASLAEVHLGLYYVSKSDFKRGDSILLKHAKKPLGSLVLLKSNLFLGISHQYQSKLETSLDYLFKSLEIASLIDDIDGKVSSNMNIANISVYTERFDTAIDFYKSALDILPPNEKNSKATKAILLNNLTQVFIESKDYGNALKTALRAEKYCKELNLKSQMATTCHSLSRIYSCDSLYDIKKAIAYAASSVNLKKSIGKTTPNYPAALGNLARLFIKNNQYNKALPFLLEIKDLKPANKTYEVNLFKDLTLAYEKTNNYKEALKYSKLLRELNDSLCESRKEQKVIELTERYNVEKVTTKSRNQLYLFTIIVLMLFAIGLFFFIRNRNQKLQLENTQLNLLLSQLNPHFLSNALTSIQSLILQNKTHKAADTTVDLSRVMRNMFNFNDSNFITVDNDFKFVNDFLNLKRQLIAKNAILNITKDEDLDNYKIPAMFTQPLVENAIEHGIHGLDNGKVAINYSQTKTHIVVTITDNGKGFKQNTADSNITKSSTSVLNDRIELYKKRAKYDIQLKTVSANSGTTVCIKFPKKHD